MEKRTELDELKCKNAEIFKLCTECDLNVEVNLFTKHAAEIDRLRNIFTYHAPKDGQQDRYEFLRSAALNLAIYIQVFCPESRERSVALTKLQELVMWANASIAINE